ncbi:hypothetical protein Tco_0648647 [Tanacetum coccineum]
MVPIQISLTLMNENKLLIQVQPRTTTSTEVPTADLIVMTSMIELESLFSPLFDEYLNGENQVVSKSSAVTTADASDKRQQQPDFWNRNPNIGTTVEYQKVPLASLNVSTLDKPHFKLENLLRRFIHESNPDIDDGVTTSFQHRQTHYHMLIIKLQRHTIGIKDSRNQESSKYTKTKATKSNKERNGHSNVRLLAFKMVQGMSMLVQITR